jgi:uncharacterized protein YndB with AHSA1/START domain
MSSITGTVEIENLYPVSPEKVFAAWASAEAMLIWSAPPAGWEMSCDDFKLEVGHTDEWLFGPVGGEPYINRNEYTAIEPGRRIVYTTTLAYQGELKFAGAVSVTFEPSEGGCRLHFTEAGIHIGQDDREGHAEGWQCMLDALGSYLTEPATA